MDRKKDDTINAQSPITDVIAMYTKTWSTLLAYDEDRLFLEENTNNGILVEFDYDEAIASIAFLKEELYKKGEATPLFGLERDKGLQAILGNIIQTFDKIPVYPSSTERAAHLLYFIIKDHPFSDGNKRIGCFLFLLFLHKSMISLSKIDNNGLITLALLIAESHHSQKEIMIKLTTRLIE